MVFQKPNPFPAMSIADNVTAGAEASTGAATAAVGPRPSWSSAACARRAVERGQGPAGPAGRRPVRRPAAAAVHRPLARGRARDPADGRAVLGARPDLDPLRRGDDRRAGRGHHHRHRHPQHAAGRPGLPAVRLLPRRERAPRVIVEQGPTAQLFDDPPTRAPATTSTAGSGEVAAAMTVLAPLAPELEPDEPRVLRSGSAPTDRVFRGGPRRSAWSCWSSPWPSGCSSATRRSRRCATTGWASSPSAVAAGADTVGSGRRARRHGRGRARRAGRRVPAGAAHRAVHQRVRAARLQVGAGLAGRPHGRGARASSTACGASSCSSPTRSYLSRWLSQHLGWIPIFKVDTDPNAAVWAQSRYTASAFIAGIAVSMMVIPLACAVMRGVFAQAPIGEREAALALGRDPLGGRSAPSCCRSAGRHHRRHDARPRPGARRDRRRAADHLAGLRDQVRRILRSAP